MEAIKAYLAQVVKAHLHCLLEAQVLPPNLDMEMFTSRAIEDATKSANHSGVNEVARENVTQLVDICRVSYLMAANCSKVPNLKQFWMA